MPPRRASVIQKTKQNVQKEAEMELPFKISNWKIKKTISKGEIRFHSSVESEAEIVTMVPRNNFLLADTEAHVSTSL